MSLRVKILISFFTFIIIVVSSILFTKHENFNDYKSMVELVIKTKRTKASIDDYKFFENNVVYKSQKPIHWAKHKQYNRLETTKQLEAIHNEYESTAFLIIMNDSIIHEKYFLGYDESSMI